MAITPYGFLPTTLDEIFNATVESAILSITFCNITTVQRKITLHISGTYAAEDWNTAAVIYLNGENSFSWSGDEKLVLAAGEKLWAKADGANAVTAIICYKEIG